MLHRRAGMLLLVALAGVRGAMRAQGAPPAAAPVPRPATVELPLKHAPEETTTAIDVTDLMTRTYILADDSMEGRDAGRRGAVRAAAYIAGELRRLGLEPAGDNGTYFQTIPLVTRRPDSAAAMRVGQHALAVFSDYELVPRLGTQPFLGGELYGGSFVARQAPTIWGGRIGEPTMLSPERARGKVVVFGAPRNANRQPIINFWVVDNLLRYSAATAVAVVEPNGALPAFLRQPRDFYNDPVVPWPAMTVMMVTTGTAEQIFGGALDDIAPGSAGQPLSGKAGFVDTPTEAPAQNIIAVLPGSDSVLRREYVAIGAHIDHIAMLARPVDHDSIRAFNAVMRPRGVNDPQPARVSAAQWSAIHALLDSLRRLHAARPDSINNGADDDASGSVLALEIAEAFAPAAARPKRSLLFVWHTAEEKGLYGSEYFTDHATVPRDSIVAQITMDQMGRGDADDAPPGGPNALVVIGARRLSTQLGDLAEAVNQRPGYGFAFDYEFDRDGDPTNAYCRNDHFMYARYGIPVVFFSAAVWHRDYHMVTDEPQYLAYDRMARIGRYVRDFAGELANLPHRPIIDGPKPSPGAACKQ